LDPRVWRETEASLRDFIAYPGIQAWWRLRSHWFSEEFVKFVDQAQQTALCSFQAGHSLSITRQQELRFASAAPRWSPESPGGPKMSFAGRPNWDSTARENTIAFQHPLVADAQNPCRRKLQNSSMLLSSPKSQRHRRNRL